MRFVLFGKESPHRRLAIDNGNGTCVYFASRTKPFVGVVPVRMKLQGSGRSLERRFAIGIWRGNLTRNVEHRNCWRCLLSKLTRYIVLALVILAAVTASVPRITKAASADAITHTGVMRTEAFLNTLTPAQKAVAQLAYNDPKRATWHNGPPSMVPRPGVKLGDLTPEQRAAAMEMLKSLTSAYGYEKVIGIMTADDYFGRSGARFKTGPDAYSVAIFGTPSDTQPWELQWNGHHLGLNVTVVGKERVLAPTLTGAYPAVYKNDAGETVRVMEKETGRAFKLMTSLAPALQSKALLKAPVMDLVLGPGQDGKVIEPEGVKASEFTSAQKAMLLDLAAAWVDIMPDVNAKEKMAEIRAHMNDTYFAWDGSLTQGERAYFRVQGPTVFIEYGPQVDVGGPGDRSRQAATAAGGNQAASGAPAGPPAPRERDPNHVHTIYRDFTNDYARRFAAAAH